MSPPGRPPSSRALVRRPHTGLRIDQADPDRHGTRAHITVLRRNGAVHDFTIGEIARAAGLNTSTVAHIFAGRRVGALRTLMRIADAMGVSLDILAGHLQTRRPTRQP